MRIFRFIVCILATTILSSQAQSPVVSSQVQSPVVKARLDNIAKEFGALSKEVQANYVALKSQAFEARQQQKYLSCMVAIDDAQQIFKKDMDLLFLKGICRAQIHDVDKALEHYNEVLAIDPNHIFTMMNVIEINFFDGRYQEAIKNIKKMNRLIDSRANGQRVPLLEFKNLVSLTKLAQKEPAKYGGLVKKNREKYTFMDDNPYFYYASALKAFDDGDKQEGLIWILKAYLIFGKPQMIETWNKALIDTGYIDAHEIMFKRRKER